MFQVPVVRLPTRQQPVVAMMACIPKQVFLSFLLHAIPPGNGLPLEPVINVLIWEIHSSPHV
jgi:hypothetical protein